MSEWRLIDTAPLNTLIRVRGKGFVGVGSLGPGRGYYLEEMEMTSSGTLNRESITHWMPLSEDPR